MDKTPYCVAHDLASEVLNHFTHIPVGRNNWVFESGDKILTVPRHTRVKSYAIRVKATEFLASQGIPVAPVLDYSPESADKPEYLVVQRIDGSNVDLTNLDEVQRKLIHFRAGQTLRKIHSITRRGHGRLDKSLEGTSDSWLDFADSYFEEAIRRVRESEQLDQKYGRTLELEYLAARERIAAANSNRFLHADFHLGNLFFRNLEVVAVLDLDLVTSGDPCLDTGHYKRTFNVDRESGVKAFGEGYGLDLDPELEKDYCLMIWARKIGSQVGTRPIALAQSVSELDKILEKKI